MQKKPNRSPWRGHDGSVDLDTLACLMRFDRAHRAFPVRDEHVAAAPCKITFLAANPSGTGQLKLAEECAESQRELRSSLYRGDFSFEARWAVTIDELFRCLNEVNPTVIHFAGHASAQGLMLQDERDEPDPVSPRGLAAIIGVAAPDARLVILNSCSGLEHAEALRGEVDAVVAMAGPITDVGARMFSARLYGALGHRKSVANAVAQGVARLVASGLADERLPRCFTRDGIDADSLVLSGPGRR